MHTVAPPLPTSQSPAPWLLAGAVEPTQIVDQARQASLEHSGGFVEPGAPYGVRRDAAYRRFGAQGGRPKITAAQLEDARVGLDRHRGREWRAIDVATIEEIAARSATPADIGARAGNLIQSWFRLEGSEGARIVPRRLQPLVALVWWAYEAGRFGVLASTVELGAELGVDPRTIRAWRSHCVRLGLLRRGSHTMTGEGGEAIPHNEVDRTWRPGKFKRPCDRARNLYRIGPVLEELAAATVAQGEPRVPGDRGAPRNAPREAREAAAELRKAARLAAYRRTGEVWDRETGGIRPPSTTPARRGPRPVSEARLERTRPGAAAVPAPAPRPARTRPASVAIARIKDPGTPSPLRGSSGRRGGCPPADAPVASRSGGENARPCSSAPPSAGLPPRGAGDSPATPSARPPGQAPPPPGAETPIRPEPRLGAGAGIVPSARGPTAARDAADQAFAALLARTAAAGGWTFDPGDLEHDPD